MISRGGLAAWMLIAVIPLSACRSSDVGPAQATAVAFMQHIADKDYQAACEELADATAQKLADDDGSCAQGLEQAGLEAGEVAASTVYGHEAIAHTAKDALVLGLMKDGWRVQAAGCTALPDDTLDCDVED